LARPQHRTAPGSTYFVTTKAADNSFLFQTTKIAEVIVSKLLEYRSRGAYQLHEFVLMPNHLHLLLSPSENVSLEKAMQFIKGGSAHALNQLRGSKVQLWQTSFYEATIRDAADYFSKVRYIRQNPVAAQLVERPEKYEWGSASGKFVLDGIPQRLKPPVRAGQSVGPKGQTP